MKPLNNPLHSYFISTMKFSPLFSFILLSLLVACGGSEHKQLSKQERVRELQKQVIKINQEIRTLKEEISKEEAAAGKKIRTIPVGTEKLAPQSFSHYFKIQGKVDATKSVMVSTSLPGTLSGVFVKQGDVVRQGQVLAKVDDAVMQSGITEARNGLALAQSLFEKQERLWQQGIGTEVQYLTAKNQKEAAEKRIATMQEQLKQGQITAPISGTVEDVFVDAGEMAAPGVPIFRIINFSALSLKAEVPENYLPYIKKGDNVTVTFPTLNRTLSSRVTLIGNFINPIARSFTVDLSLPADPMIKPNLMGEASFNDKSVSNALVVPTKLIQNSEEGSFVYVAIQEGGAWVAKRKLLKMGADFEGRTEILSGLSNGDLLITAGNTELSDGQPIELPSETTPSTTDSLPKK